VVEIDKIKSSLRTDNLKNTVKLEGCRLIKNLNHVDNRGSFKKILPIVDDTELINFPICQVNLSTNILAGTIRGLHYQVEPFLEAKLISCIKGRIIDILLDMRPSSKTYGKYAYYNLTPDSGSLFVPPLVAHGFQSLEDETTLLYLHSNDYSPDNSQGVNSLDPSLGINWPLPISSISESDRNLPSLSEVKI
jgi:dTDP-4-dehydrorhamnose 3,5-epimerase